MIKVKSHVRNRKVVRDHYRHPAKIGTSWKGKKYIHGPRKQKPSRYSEFRLGKTTKEGKRLVFGKIKRTNRWEVQSKLTPKNYGFIPISQFRLDQMSSADKKRYRELIAEKKNMKMGIPGVFSYKKRTSERHKEINKELDLILKQSKSYKNWSTVGQPAYPYVAKRIRELESEIKKAETLPKRFKLMEELARWKSLQ